MDVVLMIDLIDNDGDDDVMVGSSYDGCHCESVDDNEY